MIFIAFAVSAKISPVFPAPKVVKRKVPPLSPRPAPEFRLLALCSIMIRGCPLLRERTRRGREEREQFVAACYPSKLSRKVEILSRKPGGGRVSSKFCPILLRRKGGGCFCWKKSTTRVGEPGQRHSYFQFSFSKGTFLAIAWEKSLLIPSPIRQKNQNVRPHFLNF